MDGWIKNLNNNSVWSTNIDLFCDLCGKKSKSVYSVKLDGNLAESRYCFKCFANNPEFIFQDKEFVYLRMIEKVEPTTIKKIMASIRQQLTKSLRYDVLQRDNFKCKACRDSASISALVIDHIQPVSKGGKSTLDNLQALCQDCNAGKGAKFNNEK